jgi:hypothetical protein
MAHVAISKDFLNRVDNKIDNMVRAELNTLGNEPVVTLNPESPVALKAIWGEHLHLRDLMPKDWKGTNNSLRLMFNTKQVKLTDETVPISFAFYAKPSSGEFEFPPNGYWNSTKYIHPDDMTDPALQQIIAYGEAKAEIEARWDLVRTKVVTFFKSCKSMGEAVKLWPDCKVYIDSDDIERFERKVVKTASQDSEAAKVLAGMDTDGLMGAAVVARLSGAA